MLPVFLSSSVWDWFAQILCHSFDLWWFIDDETSDNKARLSSILLSIFVYTILEDSCYIIHPNNYQPVVRWAPSWLNDICCWERILAGHIYNDEQFLEFFWIHCNMLPRLASLLKDCPSFQSHEEQCKHFSHELHLLVTMKYFGSETIIYKYQGWFGYRQGQHYELCWMHRVCPFIFSLAQYFLVWCSGT